MEILHKFKENGYFTAELYHLLAKKKLVDPSTEIIPSEYIKEMSMSTLERLQSLNNIHVDNITKRCKKPDQIVLSITPNLIVFQNYKPNDKIVTKFTVMNISKAPTYLNMTFKESSYFFVKPSGKQLLSRLAPGISVTFAVTFMPVQYEDYTHRVMFNTDIEQYVVPFIGMGPRPIFNIPDSIIIPKAPLKVDSFALVTIQNIGMIPAGFQLSTKSPFSVQPKSAYLNPQQKIEIRVGFKTMYLGETAGLIFATFETGENFWIRVTGKTYTVSIELEKEVIRFGDTYKTMARQLTYKIINKSDQILTYMCMKNNEVSEDFEEKVKLATIMYKMKKSESVKDVKLVHYDVLSSDEHERVYSRIFFDEIQALVADETLYFQNTHFSISPIKGKLWPNQATELTMTFNPQEIGEFEAVAYLDIDGVYDRLSLKFVGISLPPAITLNVETLDMGKVYINKNYNYEIVAMNKGHINGVILYRETPTLFGSIIICTPLIHCLRPGEKQIFVISFCNSNQGPYFEEINFSIRDTNVILKLYLKGEVIYPSLTFSIPCLDFDMVSIGVPKTLEMQVINESTVHVSGSVKISSDGPEISSITLVDYAVAHNPKPEVPQWPREFHIEPCKINIEPQSRVTLKVTLTANLVRANQTALELELEKSDSPPIVLRVTFDARVPKITPAPNIRLRAAFLDFLYEEEIIISANNFFGYFTLEESEEDANTDMEVIVKTRQGLIKPNSTICLPVTIKTSVLGEHDFTIRMLLFGLSKPIEICHISGCGVRPIVTCMPTALHWGQVKLLTRTQKLLTLCNDSPVKVNFKASLLNRDGRWNVTPSEAYINPEAEIDLLVSLNLIDADTYSNKVIIQLENVKDIYVPLSATGVGTSIIVGELRERIVLGRHFTKIPLNCKVVMENCGTRLHSLEWSEYYKAPKTKQQTTSFFNLEPRTFKMGAGEKLELAITGLSHKVCTMKEVWYLIGSVEGINKKELLLECQIVAEFVDPKIEVSSPAIDFQYDYGPYSEYYKLTDIITIKNVSKLPLDMDISVRPPFALIQKSSFYKILPEEENLCCCICYNKSDLNMANILKESGSHQSKIFIDYLTQHPVEPLRKSPLHFFQDINKIKMAFNLTNAIEECLEDQDVMKIQILFDTTKHTSLKSKVYADIMKVKFKGHKNKDCFKLTGRVNFPNMLVLTPKVDFQCILNSCIESKTIEIQNVTPLHVCYQLQWKKCSITRIQQPVVPAMEFSVKEAEKSHSTSELHEIMVCQNTKGSVEDSSRDNMDLVNEIPTQVTFVGDMAMEENEAELTNTRILPKILPMLNPEYDEKFEWQGRIPKFVKYHGINLNDVLQVAPHRGLLKPNETQYVHVIFRPKQNINVRAVLECEVLGGPPEYILVTGQSSDLMYKINTNKINYKIRSFHEKATETLTITNIAQLPFMYRTYLNEPKFENELGGTICDILPASKLLEAEEQVQVEIMLRTGIVGFFSRTFLLEIGHLPHLPIEVFGWGVIPQVYLSLPRPEIHNLPVTLGYLAITLMTTEYLEAINEQFRKNTSEHLNSPFIDKCFEDNIFKYDWHICSQWDGCPSSMDVEMAIERMQLIEHVKLKPELLTLYSTTSKMGPIPGFHTTPYVIDYGVVITGSTVQYITEIINYGPIPTKLHFSKGTIIPNWLNIKLCGKLNPGESGKLEVVFSPTSINFVELEQSVETSFYLEVPYGVTIPVHIKALCAVPYLKSNVTSIDFGSVRCGDKIISSISLKNVGKPTCIWYVTLKLKSPGAQPMMVLDTSGKYEPGKGGWLSVAFKPTMEMVYEGILIFRFHMNPTRMTIPVKGQGIVPQVHVIGPNVVFPPTLPWSDTTDIYFGLTNTCPFPIELIIAHSDSKWKEEEAIYNLLNKYYSKPEEMLVPSITPGIGLPHIIRDFYTNLYENVDKQKKEEATAAAKAAATSARATAASASKKGKSPKGTPKLASVSQQVTKRFRTEAEIIADEIKLLKDNNVDPLQKCLQVFKNDNTDVDTTKKDHSKGLIVFAHGSPCEETICQEMAYHLGIKLGIPTVSIDLCIVEALCICKCSAKAILVNALHETYNCTRKTEIRNSEDDEVCEDRFDEYEDEFDVILKKIDYLAVARNAATPRSKTSEKKKVNSSMVSQTVLEAMGSTTMFQVDLMLELLTNFFSLPKFNRGFIVTSLTSKVFKSPSLVMTTVLKSKQSIHNIHLIMCHSDFSKWAQKYEETQRANELVNEVAVEAYNEKEIQEIIQAFEEMDAEEYDNALPELKQIYYKHGLEARKQKHGKLEQANEMAKKEKGKEESKLLLQTEATESKKKITKRDDPKGKQTSEYVIMNAAYTEYSKNVFDNIINIANNWIVHEAELGYPLLSFNGQLVGVAQKKAKKKSEEQLLQTLEMDSSKKGFPITFILCPCLQYKSGLVELFRRSPEVVKALKKEEEPDILKYPGKRKEFTVLIPKIFPYLNHEESLRWRYLEEPLIKKCECNQLTDLNLLDDSTQNNVLDILSKWHCTCGKKMTSSQTSTTEVPSTSIEKYTENSSTDNYFYPLPLRRVKSTENLQGRLVLQPGDLVRCKFSFNPQIEGIFSVTRFVEVSGWPDSRVAINVSAICDLPRLDSRPKKMFENFTRKTVEDYVYKITFLDDQKKFEFGPIFIGADRIYEEEYSVDLKNSSLITAHVNIAFYEANRVFTIDQEFMSLEPGCRGKLMISAAPTEVDVHTSVLLLCVKNNPEVVAITISCSGVVPIVEIFPLTKVIEYGKLLLYRREDDRFIVKNDTILPIKWKLRGVEDFSQDFIIAKTSGVVPRYDNQVVPLTYIASRVGVISNMPLIIDIYDAEGRGEPMLTDTILLSAECYDVQVECAYEDPNENSLNYGNVKVNSSVMREMYMLNRGKYSIYFKLKKVKNFPEPSLLKTFQVTPECGLIPPSLKLILVEFECTPTTSMNLVNVPAYICSLLDGSKNQVVVAEFPVCVTIASFYNTFTLFPLGELNFHIIAIGSAVMREVILNNTSKCPVTFQIELPPKYQLDPNLPPPVAKTKDNKIKNPPMKCGNFLIMNDDFLLAPGTSRTILIQFIATAARKFEETIKFIISDTCPAEVQGVPLKLVGTGAMPTLDLWNLETTFREHLIVKNLSEYKVPESSPHCVFVEDSVTLHFFSVTVNTSYTGAIDLYNNGLVACALAMKLHYQSNTNSDIFYLDKYETHIQPLMHKNLGIIFSPKALEEYRAVLEIKLKLLDNKELSSKICLIGKGVIPRIQMVFPPIRQHRISLLRFPVTCLGSVSSKPIRFKNISTTMSLVQVEILHTVRDERPVFCLTARQKSERMMETDANDNSNTLEVLIKPAEIATINVLYNPREKGKDNCEVKLTIVKNPYENFTVLCEAEAFIEDVILIGLEMLSMDIDLDIYKHSGEVTTSTASTMESRKKSRSAPIGKKPVKAIEKKTKIKTSQSSVKRSELSLVPAILKYLLDFGGCELLSMQKRSVIMVNNSEKVYKFMWEEVENLIVKPSMGYISPGEEKDLEIIFYSAQPIILHREFLNCSLTAINDETLTMDMSGATWDNRQIVTLFDKKRSLNERHETIVDEQAFLNSGEQTGSLNIIIIYSATTEYSKYHCTLKEEMKLKDTFIYQTRTFSFKVENIGHVALKIVWDFQLDSEYPARIDKNLISKKIHPTPDSSKTDHVITEKKEDGASNVTLFSGDLERDSVDTWFEIDLPFQIQPVKECLKPKESRVFKVTFAPLDAFDYKVRLKCNIDNLDPYDQIASCRIKAKSLIPYVHLDIEESDYLTSGRRKVTGVALPPHVTVLEYNVLGSGCYKKSFNVINPTSEGYEFNFEMIQSDKPEFIPVHCNMLKGFVEGGTSTEVVFTFSPTAPGVYESNWKFLIPVHFLVMNLLVVGIVREPNVVFIPTILIKNSLVGFTTNSTVMLKNNEEEALKFEFKGNSLCNESGKTPVIVQPDAGVLKPRSETPISIFYTPIQDGPLSFKIFCNITYMTKLLTLCVNALSHSINPKVTYYLSGNEHLLCSEATTNIHLDQTASTYERTVPFLIKNDGSATFFFDWHYVVTTVKKYLNVRVEPNSGHVTPGNHVKCILYFRLKQVPVQAFPVSLLISDGPKYKINLYAEIEKPLYHFSAMAHDFGKCIVNAPDTTYKKSLVLINDDKVPIIADLNFSNLPELFVENDSECVIHPTRRMKITVYFRPKQVKEYEFKLHLSVNSLCKEIITIKGEGVPLLLDLYEGCQKSFDLGPVKVGEKIVRTIDVMNHSKVPIDSTFIFRDMYPVIEDTDNSEGTSVCLSPSTALIGSQDAGVSRVKMLQHYKDDQIREQIMMDIQNALSSLKVVPNKCTIQPYRKVPLKIQFKPVGIISTLNVQLNMKVFEFERPLVRLSGSATGMSLCLNQSSLQFGRVRKRGCKILKVMLMNKGDFGAKFWWQPLISDEFTISPLQGNIAAHTNVSFTITFRPINHNPFIKVWASCNIENYMPLELAMYATCVDFGSVQYKNMLLECPVREVLTDYVVVTNPSDDVWLVLSEVAGGGPFETLKEFNIEPNSTFPIPIHFKPKTMGKHEAQILYSPLGESAVFVTILAAALHPNPNGTINVTVSAKEAHVADLLVHNITDFPESYLVTTEITKITPDRFEGYYEMKFPESVKVWGDASATCQWKFVCFKECEMHMRVLFVNEDTREYQFYNIIVTVTPSEIVDTIIFVSRARESVQKEMAIVNPLAEEVEFYVKCEHIICPEVLNIGRNSETTLVMTYSPLVVGETEEFLEVFNPLIGSYVYKVKMKCLAAKEKDLEFTTPFGSSIPIRLRIQNNTETKAVFVTSVAHSSILAEKEYVLAPSEKGKFLVWFEPTELGVQQCKVSFDSIVAGEFVFNIKGIATPPKPQGPYNVKVGGFTLIKFKNVFEDVRTFRIYVDKEDFYVKTFYEPIRGKKEIKIPVYLSERPQGWHDTLPTACLNIETFEPADPKVHWTFFLKGVL